MPSPSPTTFSATALTELGATRTGVLQLRREWVADDPRAVILVVHGISEHSGRYEHVGQYLSAQGYGVVSYDQRGFGQSGGRRAHALDIDEFLDDVEDHLAVLRQPDRPVVVLGHSMGGLIAAAHACSNRPQPDGLILSGAALLGPMPEALAVVPKLLAPLAGRRGVSLPIATSVLSRDQAVCDAYDDDPLVDTRSTLDLYNALSAGMRRTRARLDRIRVPTLALHGADDELVPPAATELLSGRPGIETRLYPGHRHEIFNELDWEAVLGDVVDWLGRQGL